MEKRLIRPPHTLVVGGSRGIGRSLVRLFVEQGHRVSVMSRHPLAHDRMSSNPTYWPADVTQQTRLPAVISSIIGQVGRLDNLVCLQRYRGGSTTSDTWRGHIDTTLTGTKVLLEAAREGFVASGGAIVLVSSIADHLVADEQPVAYHVARAGLSQMVRYYAVLFGARGIRVNGVAPGAVLKDESRAYYLRHRRLHALFRKLTPLGRIGTAEEICRVILFLCSPDAAFLTGQNIVVDGGLSLRLQESLVRAVSETRSHARRA